MIGKEKAKKPDFNSLNNYLTANPKINQIKKHLTQKDKKKSDKKGLNNLEKITGSGDINIAGNQPIIIYKKQSNNKKISKSPNPFNSKYTINKNKFEYVSKNFKNIIVIIILVQTIIIIIYIIIIIISQTKIKIYQSIKTKKIIQKDLSIIIILTIVLI